MMTVDRHFGECTVLKMICCGVHLSTTVYKHENLAHIRDVRSGIDRRPGAGLIVA